MRSGLTRTILIWAVTIWGLVNIYPTVGWMMLSEEAKQERTEAWKEEDEARLRDRPNTFMRLLYGAKRWAEFDSSQVITLGLDLQGGVHMVLGFNLDELPEEVRKRYEERGMTEAEISQEVQDGLLEQVRRRVDEFEAQEPVIQKLGATQIQVQLPGEKDIERAKRLITRVAQLDFHIVAGTDETVEAIGRIKSRFPEITDVIQRPRFQGGPFRVPAENIDTVRKIIADANAANLVPEGKAFAFSPPPKPWAENQEYEMYLMDAEPAQRGEGLESAMAMPDQTRPGFYEINFRWSPSAGQAFGDMTERNQGRHMAIVIDDAVLSAPTIQERIGISGRITGDFSPEEARDLAIALNSGSTVLKLHEEYTGVVGPSLGAESVRAGVSSGVIGLALVGVFVLIYYMWAGLATMIALTLNAILIVAAMAYFDLTLTLPGIAGLILTIGMAVDANVLIFERVREELRLGHSMAASIESGFNRAAVTILDANVTTLIAALVLMQFGTGPIEGFAVALSIGVVFSVFTALVVTRGVMDFLVDRGIIKKLRLLQAFNPDRRIPFMQYRTPAAAISVVVIVLSLGIFGYRGADNFGVDFIEGTNLQLRLNAERVITVDEVRQTLAQSGYTTAIVQEAGEGGGMDHNHFIIRVAASDTVAPAEQAAQAVGNWLMPVAHAQDQDAPIIGTPDVETRAAEVAGDETAPTPTQTGDTASVPAEMEAGPSAPSDEVPAANADTLPAVDRSAADIATETVSSKILAALAPLTDAKNVAEGVTVELVTTVGPAVGDQLRRDAVLALIYSLFFIFIYVAFRFEWRFSLGAVVALFHDVIITLGCLALFGREISMPVVAAILTVIGYSLNDTIVIFDRIREDMRVYRGKGYSLLDIMNLSINETLSRTILTGLTTAFVVVVLFLFGGGEIEDFAFVLLVGLIVGTYSSIFVASPIVWLVQYLRGRHEQPSDVGSGRGVEGGTPGKPGAGPHRRNKPKAVRPRTTS